MAQKHYFDPADLAKFGDITKWQKAMGDKYFAWYGETMKEGALTEREKALIALAVAHAIQCPLLHRCLHLHFAGKRCR